MRLSTYVANLSSIGRAKLDIPAQNEDQDDGKHKEEGNAYQESVPVFGADHFSATPVARGIGNLVHFKPVGKFAILFFHRNVAELVLYKERIIFRGLDIEVDHDDGHVAIDHEVTGIITMKQANAVTIAIISDIGPGELAHVALDSIEIDF